ncbi:ExbD/TolR family protein [Pelagicoccus mobilis]|uniref:Biopolymer transporter ExbD n=1 Tax=Pelagicoccus mobilis TaxID=415221 RepID=A0A934S0B1_9BACT|nr:biopolymer transporter ExbD [Pelagicoccus mobilis]
MVFILLIFFIVTTVFVEESGLELFTPEASPVIELDAEPFVLTLTKGGAVFYGGREIGFDLVESEIRSARARGEIEGVTLKIHPQARVQAAARLLDICEGQGVGKVTMRASEAR